MRLGFKREPLALQPGPATWFESVLKKRIVVHTNHDQSIEGTLMEQTADGVILRAAKLLGETEQAGTTMAGEVFVPRENVAFAQLDE
jgi:hypothetical protein